MGRLTFKKPNGEWGLNNFDIKKVPSELYGAICKLRDYEETGLNPAEVAELKARTAWIPADQPPESDDYVLLSFANATTPTTGRYEGDEENGGNYYVGNADETLLSLGFIVNGWMPLPKRKEE